MFINLSNHPSENWSEEQIKVTNTKYGEIYDFPFPAVDPEADEAEIREIAGGIINSIHQLFNDKNVPKEERIVMCQGEFTLSFIVISKLIDEKIEVVAAVSKREVSEIMSNGISTKIASFKFKGYRKFEK